jgi:hypothetical protein
MKSSISRRLATMLEHRICGGSMAASRATSRACSLTSRAIRRAGMLGQHFGLSGQTRQFNTDAK